MNKNNKNAKPKPKATVVANKKSKPVRKNVSLMNRMHFSRTHLLTVAALFAVIGGTFLMRSRANELQLHMPVERFVTVPERGLQWAAMKAAANPLCGGLLELVDDQGRSQGCTHGPDPAPPGVDVRRSVPPVGRGILSRLTGKAQAAIACDGDGVSGKRVEVLYARPSDRVDRYDQYASSFQTWLSQMNDIFMASAQQTGGTRNIRFVTDANCQPVIRRVVLSATGDDTFSNTVTELKNLGYNQADRKYLIWMDSTVYCGIANIYKDDKPTLDNLHNGVYAMWGRVDSGCWGTNTAAHELGHNLGAVQYTAPNTSNGGHCIDEYDVMCYKDSSTVTLTYPCASSENDRLDCNKNDYFHTNPPAGSYLATKWNTANSGFLFTAAISSPPTTPPPTTPPPPPAQATLTYTPSDDARINKSYPGSNYGSSLYLNADNSPVVDMLLKFNVSGINGRRVVSAKLKLYCNEASAVTGGKFYPTVSSSWSQSTVTWNNAPAIVSGDPGRSLGAVTAGKSYEVDVTSLVKGDGAVSLRANSSSGDGVGYSSKENSTASYRPQLIVTVE